MLYDYLCNYLGYRQVHKSINCIQINKSTLLSHLGELRPKADQFKAFQFFKTKLLKKMHVALGGPYHFAMKHRNNVKEVSYVILDTIELILYYHNMNILILLDLNIDVI